MDSHFIELLRGAVGGLIARIAAALGVFTFGVMLARLLGAADSGLFYLALAVVTVAAVLSRAGLDGTVVRFVAAHLAHAEREAAGMIYLRAVAFVLAAAILISAALYGGAQSLALTVFDKPELAASLHGMVFVLVPLALCMLHGQFLQAEKHVGAAVLVQTGLLPLLMTGVFLLVSGWNLAAAIQAYAAGAWVTLLVSVLWQRSCSSYRPVLQGNYDFAPLLRSARSLAASDLINKIIQPWAPVIFLGMWSTASSIGLFAAANRLAALVVFATVPVNRMLAPKMAALWAKDQRAGFFRLAQQATLLMLAVSVPVAVALFAAPELLLGLFGSEFTGAGLLLWILAGGQLFNALTGPVRSMLIMTGHEHDHRLSSAAGGIVILVLCFALIPPWQDVGAAIAATAGLVVNNLVAALLVWRRLGVLPLLGDTQQ